MYEQFQELLKKANLNKKEFAELVEMNYTSVTNWNSKNTPPKWVKSWLENYIAKQKHEQMLKIIKDGGGCNE